MSTDLSPIKDQLAVIQQGIRQHFNAMSDETGAWNEICTYLTKLEMGIVPLTVIAPPLEWITQTHGLWYSTDLKHRIVKTNTGFEWQRKLPNIGLEKWERMFENQTFEDIEGVINEWRQIGVNQALEGCNVVPYRDPQPLVDALRQISEVLKRFCQTGKLGELQQSVIDAELILKEWEEGK